MDEVCLKVLFYLVRGKKSKKKIAEAVGVEQKYLMSALELLKNMGLVEIGNNSVNLKASIDEIVSVIMQEVHKKAINVPFTTKIVSKHNFKYMVVPAYLVRTFNIEPGDLLVMRIGDTSFSGTLSTKKSIFYIHKRYWNKLGLDEIGTKEVNVVLEMAYKKVGGELNAEVAERADEEGEEAEVAEEA